LGTGSALRTEVFQVLKYAVFPPIRDSPGSPCTKGLWRTIPPGRPFPGTVCQGGCLWHKITEWWPRRGFSWSFINSAAGVRQFLLHLPVDIPQSLFTAAQSNFTVPRVPQYVNQDLRLLGAYIITRVSMKEQENP